MIPYVKPRCNPTETEEEIYLSGLTNEWIPLTLSHTGIIDGLLLAACRSMVALYGHISTLYLESALRYKGEIIKNINRAITEEGFSPSDVTLAMALLLASDEVCFNFSAKSHHDSDAIPR